MTMKLHRKALACTSSAKSHSTSCSTVCDERFWRKYLLATLLHVYVQWVAGSKILRQRETQT